MPIANYSVLKGHPVAGKVVSGASAHYQITVAAGRAFTVAVNIESVDGSEVLYTIKEGFTPPDPAGLQALPLGIAGLPSAPGSLALDFVRETIAGLPMVTRAEMTLLPIATSTGRFVESAPSSSGHFVESASSSSRHFVESAPFSPEDMASPEEVASPESAQDRAAHALENAVVQLLNQAVADPKSVVYAFGSAFADRGVVDGIHDIHMNQGNPLNNHGNDNGTWQDGALFIHLPSQATWTALFIAFQTESWTTDEAGNPVTPPAVYG